MQTTSLALDKSLRSIDPQNGHMTVEMSRISKANVCPYLGREIPGWQKLGLSAERTYMLLRSPDELARAAPTFSNLPLLEKHVPIHAEAPSRELWVGTTGEVTFEHPYLVSRPLKVWTQRAIDLIESEAQKELSSGYGYVADMSPGIYEGVIYDGVMRQIRGNHCAIVAEGRVGPDVHVADEIPPELKSMKHAVAAEKLKPFLNAALTTEQLLALDAVLGEVGSTSPSLGKDAEEKEREEKEKAEDAAHKFYGKDEAEWEKMSAKDRKHARDEWEKEEDKKAKDAADKKAKDEKDHRNDFNSAKDSVTKDEMNAALKAVADTVRKQAHDAAVAREAVKPLVGLIALDAAGMDTAEAIYGFALKQAGVKIDGVHPSAFATLLDVIKSRKPAAAPSIAFDAASRVHTVESIFRPRLVK